MTGRAYDPLTDLLTDLLTDRAYGLVKRVAPGTKTRHRRDRAVTAGVVSWVPPAGDAASSAR